ncbi:holo-ACP synthase [Actinomyces sp. 2119]|uniref:holo-ACP synthase n=1 Tax=Actinomyces sp. 2119 TaxID=2321393 RepID=UPI000E6B7866|nr:holo-ACP synthase [Actinomyces sp. 2119]RJF44755.1 holo-ACP synthase [Actinomyces sp. 2119]
MSHPTPPEVPPVPQPPPGGPVLGVGVDLVHVPGLAEQLDSPGTAFATRAFSPRERREARRRAQARGAGGQGEVQHLAARWAAKEAFVKAWSQALALHAHSSDGAHGTLGGVAPVIAPERLDWQEVEVATDRWGRPWLRLSGELAQAVETSLGRGRSRPEHWPVSLSHDGDYAASVVLAVG